MSEDKKAAEQMAIDDMRAALRAVREQGIPQQFVSFEHGPPKDLPPGDGERLMAPVILGMRGRLTKTEARKAAEMWKQAIARYPKAIFYLQLVGYDEDPREIWEIVDAARYVRWFARAAGLDDIDTALRIFGPGSPTWEAAQAIDGKLGRNALGGTLGFLSGCGVFGEEFKRNTLQNFKPTPKQ